MPVSDDQPSGFLFAVEECLDRSELNRIGVGAPKQILGWIIDEAFPPHPCMIEIETVEFYGPVN
jgi:hypothetical protein